MKKKNTGCIIRWTNLWGFMSEPTSVRGIISRLVHEDRKWNFSRRSSPTEDVVKQRFLDCCSILLLLQRWKVGKMSGGNKLVII